MEEEVPLDLLNLHILFLCDCTNASNIAFWRNSRAVKIHLPDQIANLGSYGYHYLEKDIALDL